MHLPTRQDLKLHETSTPRRLTASELSPNQSWSFRPCSWWPKLNPKAKATNSVFWDCLVPRILSWVWESEKAQWTCSDSTLMDHVFSRNSVTSRIPMDPKKIPVVHPIMFLPFNGHDGSPRHRCGLPKTASLFRNQSPWNVTRLMLKRLGCSSKHLKTQNQWPLKTLTIIMIIHMISYETSVTLRVHWRPFWCKE